MRDNETTWAEMAKNELEGAVERLFERVLEQMPEGDEYDAFTRFHVTAAEVAKVESLSWSHKTLWRLTNALSPYELSRAVGSYTNLDTYEGKVEQFLCDRLTEELRKAYTQYVQQEREYAEEQRKLEYEQANGMTRLTLEQTREIDFGLFKRSYRGKCGCMCGCLGTYQDKKTAIKRVWDNMLAFAEETGAQIYDQVYNSSHWVLCEDRDRNKTYAFYYTV